jgi:tetratricopeptide (TPR) repeat protein
MLQGRASLALHHGDYSEARRDAENGVSIARQSGESNNLVEILALLGFVARVQEDWIAARLALNECLVVSRELGHTRTEAISLHHLGLLALEAQQDYAAAWLLSEQSLQLIRLAGDRRLEGNVLLGMARVARAREDPLTARELIAQAWSAHQEVRDPGLLSILLYTGAAVAADEARLEQAVRLASAAERVNALVGTQPWPAIARERESWLAGARRGLGGPTFACAWAEGQGRTPGTNRCASHG